MGIFNNKKHAVRTDHKTVRQFSYRKNNVSLAFSLRIDIKEDLKDFRELLVEALKEVDQEIER